MLKLGITSNAVLICFLHLSIINNLFTKFNKFRMRLKCMYF